MWDLNHGGLALEPLCMITGVHCHYQGRPPCSLSSKAAEKDSTSLQALPASTVQVSHKAVNEWGREGRKPALGRGRSGGVLGGKELMENGLEG